MKFGIVANPSIEEAVNLSKKVVQHLESKDQELLLETPIAEKLGRDGVDMTNLKPDVLVCLGGDGTVLYVSQRCDAPIFAINAGNIGFLTEADKTQVPQVLDRLIDEQFDITELIKLKVEVNGQRLLDCLNEAVVHTAHVAKLRDFIIKVNGVHALRERSDGIIVATPTGSTCYSMSAGGPIMDPRVQGFVVQPIAPFKLSTRPLVVSSSSQVEITIKHNKPCILVLDGQSERPLEGSEVLRYSLSEKRARFVRFSDKFYEKLNMKITAK